MNERSSSSEPLLAAARDVLSEPALLAAPPPANSAGNDLARAATRFSHDVNNPAAYVLANLNYMLERVAMHEGKFHETGLAGWHDEMLGVLRESVEGMQRIIEVSQELSMLAAHPQDQGLRFGDAPSSRGTISLVHDATPTSSARRTETRSRVLVVDDEDAIVRALVRTLSREHEVFTASSGEDALTIVAREPGFDLVVCDLMLPNMSGMALYAELQANHPHVASRVVFLTCGATTRQGREFLHKNADRVLHKPIEVDRLRVLARESKGGGSVLQAVREVR